MRQRALFGLILFAATAISGEAHAAATWKIAYLDQGTNKGFYDATPKTAVGGNQGQTLGEQRRIAFERAVSTWAKVITSSVPITIQASMTSLECDAEGAILGQASATSAVAVPGANGSRALAYPIALGNALDGSDLEPVSADNPTGAEIQAEFNSDVGNASCLAGAAFYLGLDGQPGDDIDFLGVVLHEMGHGFGFATFLDLTTAEPLFPDAPDAFSTHALDLDRNATWDTFTQPQLLASFKNARRVVWNGVHVTQAAPRYLVKGSPRLTVAPAVAGLSGMLSEHDEGPKIADIPATGLLVLPSPATGCSRPSNAAALRGAIALIDPGTACHTLEAVAFMQQAGAAAVIAVDSTLVRPPAMITGTLEGQKIPVVSIHRDDAKLLTAQVAGRSVTLDGDPTRLVGADAQGRLYLDMTDPVMEGTSISHWDGLARNQLLMEPERSADHLDIDITREFMWDLGWPICGDGVVQGDEACDDGNSVETDGCTFACTKSVAGSTAELGTTPSAAPTNASTADSTVGCSCRLPRTQTKSPAAALLVLLLVWSCRRGHDQRRRHTRPLDACQ